MFSELNRDLDEARQGVFQLRRLDSMIQYLGTEQSTLQDKAANLEAILTKENADVLRLEKTGLRQLFYSVLGNLPQRVEKEHQEALAAKLHYDQAVSDLEDVQAELSRLNKQREQYSTCQDRYQKLYSQKKQLLLDSGTQDSQSLMDLAEQVNQRKNMVQEIREAVSAGEAVLTGVDRTLACLGSAENWGVWDVLGGGLLADLAKHSHLDDAQAEAHRTQTLLRRFNTELADVRIYGDFTFETGGFAKFADFFFDGLIADFVMQSKIQNVRDRVADVRNQVDAVLDKLREMEGQESLAKEELEAKIEELVNTSK